MIKYKRPAFKMTGSKVRLGKKYMDKDIFPKEVDVYYEPFSGRGNMFFTHVHYGGTAKEYHLNDLTMTYFLSALKSHECDYSFINEWPITKEDYKVWVAKPPSIQKDLAESFMVRHGNRWGGGPNTSDPTNRGRNGHHPLHVAAKFRTAKKYLNENKTSLYSLDWFDFLSHFEFNENDFMYLDPPYNSKQKVWYQNIDHVKMLEFANTLPCRVAISGYPSELYSAHLKTWDTIVNEHYVCVRKAVNGKKPKVKEVLWINYDKHTKQKLRKED
tara:strand:+ start:158 stop:973 length:816 start_codon:yes stop_codon:yes gene_type:complete